MGVGDGGKGERLSAERSDSVPRGLYYSSTPLDCVFASSYMHCVC